MAARGRTMCVPTDDARHVGRGLLDAPRAGGPMGTSAPTDNSEPKFFVGRGILDAPCLPPGGKVAFAKQMTDEGATCPRRHVGAHIVRPPSKPPLLKGGGPKCRGDSIKRRICCQRNPPVTALRRCHPPFTRGPGVRPSRHSEAPEGPWESVFFPGGYGSPRRACGPPRNDGQRACIAVGRGFPNAP